MAETPKKAPRPKRPRVSKGFSTAKFPAKASAFIREREIQRRRALKEERIERIAAIMRQVHLPNSVAPSWDNAVRKALAASWGIDDREMRKLSAEASKRVGVESLDPDELKRVYGPVLGQSIVECFAKRDFKNLARYIEIAHKVTQDQLANSKEKKAEFVVITPADAAAAVREMFGENAAKDVVPDLREPAAGEAESADGTEKSPSEE